MKKIVAGSLPLLLTVSGVAQDAEKATHTDEASAPQVAYEARGAGWTLRQYQLGCLSHLSYLVVAGGTAAVIDPQRDVDHYLRDADALGAKVRHVLLTHPHADFVAGHTELAHRTGAEIAVSALAHAEFPHRALRDGDRVEFGGVSFEAWATPGHTPNAMTFLLRVPGGAAEPAFALTGDTLFVGSIGRPDLLDVPPAELAAQSFASVQRLKTLPDATLVLPAHGAGSLCGAHLSPETTSTIGREKATNPYLKIASEATFVANVISHQPVAPQYFAFNVEMNRKGPPLIDRSDTLPTALAGAEVRRLLGEGGWVVDLRDQQSYAAAHIEGAVNVALRGRLDTWTGIVVPFGAPLLLVGDDDEVREGVFRLRRIGYDRMAGRIVADPDTWRRDGLMVRSSRLVTPQELHAAMQAGTEPLIVDVRSADEYADLRLGDVGNIPVTESERFAKVLAKDAPIVMVCNSAYRSSMAVGLAERLGFADVRSLDGGLDAWITAGLPTVGRMAAPATPAAGDGRLRLPEPIDATMLAKVLLEQPERYVVIDLRPAWQFEEWHVPGATNVATDALASHLQTLPADARVVLVDRDGSLAFAVAGALMQADGSRVLRVLFGGLQQYHRSILTGGAAAPSSAPTRGDAPAAASPLPAAPAGRQPQKKRSAGC
jgi:glyoxylase-like metal-dependent hydrolase (beta-lactamase superfamily II)/rhodanese-related sulfurtransferase